MSKRIGGGKSVSLVGTEIPLLFRLHASLQLDTNQPHQPFLHLTKKVESQKIEKPDGKGNKIENLVCDCDSLINLAAGMGRTPGIYIAPPSTQPRTQPSSQQAFFHLTVLV